MNTEIQKKWFVYVGDHHEGPFSVEEVRQRKASGTVTPETYVWCEGMADWQMLNQVNELASEIIKESNPREKTNSKITVKPTDKTDSFETLPKQKKSLVTLMSIAMGTFAGLFLLALIALAIVSRTSSDELHSSFRPTLVNIVDRFPVFSGLFRLVPQLPDVKADDQKELEQAQIGLPENGVKLSISLSTANPNRPYFYISSNLPHGTKLDLYLVGNSETLLNRLQYSSQSQVSLQHGMAKSEVYLSEGGQPLPKGEYTLFVSEAQEQDEAITRALAVYAPVKIQTKTTVVSESVHFLFSKTVFIGGERDQTYLTRLKAFHEKVKQNADKELLELKQYADTLQLQYVTLTTEFGRIAKASKVTPAARNNWKRSTQSWQQINSQLEQTIQTWTKETLQNEYFYGKVYELVKGAFESLRGLYTLENNYVEQPSDKNSFSIQHGKALSETREAMELLRAKVEVILKAPTSPAGLPTREGL